MVKFYLQEILVYARNLTHAHGDRISHSGIAPGLLELVTQENFPPQATTNGTIQLGFTIGRPTCSEILVPFDSGTSSSHHQLVTVRTCP